MKTYCAQFEFASPQFDESFYLRDLLLRQPLGLQFEVKDIDEEYKEIHLGIFSAFDELIGTLTFRPLSDHLLKMRQVAISDQHQGKGLGKMLVKYAEDWAIAHQYKQIELAARAAVVKFYEKLGYQKVGEEFEEVGIPHQKMVKEVS